MNSQADKADWKMLGTMFKAHPWHGVPIGSNFPDIITVYVEIVPRDTVKYELDKRTGHLKVDRPHLYSSTCPTMYGLIPQTLCGDLVAERCAERVGRTGIVGDDDPMDICVLAEAGVAHGDILLRAVPIGGMRMIDNNEADDKIIAVMKDDTAYGRWQDISDCPQTMLKRLEHYFLTYKNPPGDTKRPCEIAEMYGREEAVEMVRRSHEDYLARFQHIATTLSNSA